jgi:hypothetical protein
MGRFLRVAHEAPEADPEIVSRKERFDCGMAREVLDFLELPPADRGGTWQRLLMLPSLKADQGDKLRRPADVTPLGRLGGGPRHDPALHLGRGSLLA